MAQLTPNWQAGLVTVVMPVLNAARFLAEALASLAAQSYSPIEVLIVDGPSADETPALAQAFSGSRYWRQHGSGLWNAFNEGIAVAQGEFVAFLSADDLWLPDKIALQVAYLQAHPEVKLLGAQMCFRLIDGEEPAPGFRVQLLSGSRTGYMPEAILVRRSLFDSIGLFDEQQRTTADIDWLRRIRTAGVRFAALPDLLLIKRVHADNLSTASLYADFFQQDLMCMLRSAAQGKRSR